MPTGDNPPFLLQFQLLTIRALAIPTTLHGSLLARLDRLAPTREVAQIGAALGRSFSHELISAVATMPKQQLDDGRNSPPN